MKIKIGRKTSWKAIGASNVIKAIQAAAEVEKTRVLKVDISLLNVNQEAVDEVCQYIAKHNDCDISPANTEVIRVIMKRQPPKKV